MYSGVPMMAPAAVSCAPDRSRLAGDRALASRRDSAIVTPGAAVARGDRAPPSKTVTSLGVSSETGAFGSVLWRGRGGRGGVESEPDEDPETFLANPKSATRTRPSVPS